MDPREFHNWFAQTVKLTDEQLDYVRDMVAVEIKERKEEFDKAERLLAAHTVNRGAW